MLKFSKKEKLCNKKSIDFLFNKGETFFSYPFNVKWRLSEANANFSNQILIVVSKRNFKKAVERNKIKRLIREAYRQNKSFLYQQLAETNQKINFSLIYTEKEILNYKSVEEKIILTLHRLIKKIILKS